MRSFSPSAILFAWLVLLAASVTYAQDSSSASSSPSSSQSSESQAQSSSGSASNTASASASGSSTSSGNATTVAPSRTTVVTYSLSGTQNATVSYTTVMNITASAGSSSKTSTSQTPLKTLSTTVEGGNAGSDPTVTAPDPGNTAVKNQGPGDDYISGAVRIATTTLAVVLAVSMAVLVGGNIVV